MNRKNSFGLILLIIGIIILLNAFDILPINIFFAGWWTLFLIIPALMSMSRQGVTAGHTILLILGAGVLLKEQGWNFTQYFVPAIFIAVGIVMLITK